MIMIVQCGFIADLLMDGLECLFFVCTSGHESSGLGERLGIQGVEFSSYSDLTTCGLL